MWPFTNRKRRGEAQSKVQEQQRKITQSQLALIEAATTTADAAHMVTNRLKQHLEDSIRQFESTVRLLTDALIVCDAAGRVRAANPAAEHIFACSAKDMLNTPAEALFRHNGQQPADCYDLWKVVQSNVDGAHENAALRGRRLNGETFSIEASMTRLDRSDGTTVVLMLVRDMSNCILARKTAELHEERYRMLFDVSFDGILIVQDGRVVAANRAAGQTFGTTAESLLTTPIDALMARRKTLGTGEAGAAPVEAHATRMDGTTVHLLLSSGTIRWNDAPAALMTVKDVSEMKLLETALRTRKGNGVDMICCFTADMRITFANDAFASHYGMVRDDLAGTKVCDLLNVNERDSFLMNLRGLTPEAPMRRIQIQTAGPEGAIELHDWIDNATFSPEGEVVEYQRTGRDISDILSGLLAGQK